MKRFSLPERPGAAALAYYEGGTDGPALVLANGLGGPISAFRHQVAHFGRRYRVITWDYRGLYASRSSERIERLDVAAHADDLERVLDATGVESAVFVGWSMGVQVMLELVARAPERASHLVLMSGTYGRPFSSLPLPAAEHWLAALLDGASGHSALLARAVARAARSHSAVQWIRRLRIVSPRLTPEDLLALASEFSTLDFEVYLRTLRALGDHDGSHALARLWAPVLVVAGSRDRILPPRVASELVRRLPRAELCMIDEGTHYAPTEFPELVNARIDRFLSANARPR